MWMPISHVLFFSAVLVLGIYQKPTEMLVGVIISFLGYPIYLLGICWHPKPRSFTEKIGKYSYSLSANSAIFSNPRTSEKNLQQIMNLIY